MEDNIFFKKDKTKSFSFGSLGPSSQVLDSFRVYLFTYFYHVLYDCTYNCYVKWN